ncbi:MAG: GNAT family N-acetyltransferase [Candidatus Micrarchaeota archaeon]|nr:GNAT family N-acetyltransferase [Candidatus Micrarchaeota archaeon]
MEISTANESDNKDLTRLYYELYPEKKADPIKSLDVVRFESRVFVAKEQGEAVGFVLATFVTYAKSPTGYIEELIVSKEHRNKGIGSALVNTAISWYEEMGAEVVFVTTDEAQEFYKKIGFRESIKNKWLYWIPKKYQRD